MHCWVAVLLAHALAFARAPLRVAPRTSRAAPRLATTAVDRLNVARELMEKLRANPPPEVHIRPLDGRASPPFAHSTPSSRAPQESRDYDPEESARIFATQPMKVLRRQLELALPFCAFVLSVAVDRVLGVEKQNRPKRAAALLAFISGCGPAVIKAGQALSTRSDLLPSEYLAELQRLQDDVPPFPSELAYEVLRSELGVEPSELFAYISEEPIAAASLGQVYKAIRRSTHEPLAVKVQRPGSLEIVALDLHILRGISGVLNTLIKAMKRDLDVVGIIDDFGQLLYAELDYTKEAAHAQRFAELYARPSDRIGAPRVFPELTTRRVLVESWVDGVRITDKKALARWGLESDELVQTLVRCSLRQMLDDGFFHADPHAGNLLVTADGTLTYIDFGMVSYVTREQRLGLIESIVHLVNRDFELLANLYKELGFIPRSEPTGPIVQALEAALPDALDAPVSELNLKNVFAGLGNVMFEFPFALPPFYTAVIRCLGVLEGVALQADAKFPVIRAAYPFVAAKLLTDPSPRLQQALLDLLRKRSSKQGGASHLTRLVGILEHALGYTDPLTLTENLAQIYLIPEHAPLVRELMDQAVDMLDYLASRAPELVDGALDTAR